MADVLLDYANAKAEAKNVKVTLEQAEAAAFAFLPKFASGKTYEQNVSALRQIEESLPKLLAPSAPTFTRNVTVGVVMESTNATDVKASKALVNKYVGLGIGVQDLRAIAAKFTGTLDDLAEDLAARVTADDELDSLLDKRRTLVSQIRKIDKRVKEIEAGQAQTVF